MQSRGVFAAGLVLVFLLVGCTASEDVEQDLTVTLVFPVLDERVQRCGNLDGDSVYLEDASGALLVPAEFIQGEAPLEGEFVSSVGVFTRWCESTLVLEDVPEHDIYQLVHTAGSTVYRAGYRHSELDEIGWELEGYWRDVLKSH